MKHIFVEACMISSLQPCVVPMLSRHVTFVSNSSKYYCRYLYDYIN